MGDGIMDVERGLSCGTGDKCGTEDVCGMGEDRRGTRMGGDGMGVDLLCGTGADDGACGTGEGGQRICVRQRTTWRRCGT